MQARQVQNVGRKINARAKAPQRELFPYTNIQPQIPPIKQKPRKTDNAAVLKALSEKIRQWN